MRGVFDGLTIEADVCQPTAGESGRARIDNGRVRSEEEDAYVASFYAQGGEMQVNFATGARQRGAVLAAIEKFMAEAIG